MTALLMRKRTPVRRHPHRDSEARGGLPWAADLRQAGSILAESPAQPTPAAVTVFYDGACPLCATEIGFYQRRRGADKVIWVDASACSDSILAPGLTRTDALRRFHVRDASGQWVSGGRAFAALWSALPTFSWLGRLFQIRGLAWLLDRFYDLFLRLRPHLQALARRQQGRGRS
jgi:predicted DCC family thiol-disulfide oxidoreductase YuxK